MRCRRRVHLLGSSLAHRLFDFSPQSVTAQAQGLNHRALDRRIPPTNMLHDLVMSLFSQIKEKVAEKVLGKLITDLGSFQTGREGHTIAFEIRQYPGKPPQLIFNRRWGGDSSYFNITNMKECADYFYKAALAIREHLRARAEGVSSHE